MMKDIIVSNRNKAKVLISRFLVLVELGSHGQGPNGQGSRDQVAVEVPTRRGGSIDDGEISISRGWGEAEMF
jgi:hypothetical protein